MNGVYSGEIFSFFFSFSFSFLSLFSSLLFGRNVRDGGGPGKL